MVHNIVRKYDKGDLSFRDDELRRIDNEVKEMTFVLFKP